MTRLEWDVPNYISRGELAAALQAYGLQNVDDDGHCFYCEDMSIGDYQTLCEFAQYVMLRAADKARDLQKENYVCLHNFVEEWKSGRVDIDEIKNVFLSTLENMEKRKDKVENFLFVWDEGFYMAAKDDVKALESYSSEEGLNGFYNAVVVAVHMWTKALCMSDSSHTEVVTEVEDLFNKLLSSIKRFPKENIH